MWYVSAALFIILFFIKLQEASLKEKLDILGKTLTSCLVTVRREDRHHSHVGPFDLRLAPEDGYVSFD